MAGTPQRGQTENARFFDYSLLFILIFLLGFGLVMLYSVSSYEAVSSDVLSAEAVYRNRHRTDRDVYRCYDTV